MKPDFERSQNTATKLLLKQNISSLSLDARDFRLKPSIHIDTMQNYCEVTSFPFNQLRAVNDGSCLVKYKGHSIVLYDDTITNKNRKLWCIAHELGHAYLGHRDDNRKSEIEANFFAAQLLAPEIVLWEISRRNQGLSGHDLTTHFNLSREAANKRIKTLANRGWYSSSAIDRILLERFLPVLNQKFSCPGQVS